MKCAKELPVRLDALPSFANEHIHSCFMEFDKWLLSQDQVNKHIFLLFARKSSPVTSFTPTLVGVGFYRSVRGSRASCWELWHNSPSWHEATTAHHGSRNNSCQHSKKYAIHSLFKREDPRLTNIVVPKRTSEILVDDCQCGWFSCLGVER